MSNIIPFPTQTEIQTMKDIGSMALKSGFLPSSIKTAEQAVIIILKGREIGMQPMQAFQSIAVINGRPTISAEGMMSLIYKNVSGAVINFLSTTGNECIIEARRPSGKMTKFSFTIEDAKQAGLLEKGGPWKTYPAAMCRARCISAMARAIFPDALSGVVYTPEELGANVDDDGEILGLPESPMQTKTPEVIGDYIIKMGREPNEGGVKGIKLSNLTPAKINNLIDWLNSDAGAKLRTTEAAKEFIEKAVEYLGDIADDSGRPKET